MHRAILQKKWITQHSCARGGNPKQPPQLEGPSGPVSAFEAMWRVKPVFKPGLSCLSYVLFPKMFSVRYGFRPASGAEPKAACSSASLVVPCSGRTKDRVHWGKAPSADEHSLPFLKILYLFGLELQPGSQTIDVGRKSTGHQPLCTCTHCQAWFSLAVYMTKPTNLCTQWLSVTLPSKWHFYLVWFAYF